MNKNTKWLGCTILLSLGAPSYSDSSPFTHCGKMPILEISGETAPLDFNLYAKGDHSGWQEHEDFKFVYKGNNIYQMRANFTQNTNFKLASATWSDEFWVPSPSGDFAERQGLRLGQEYPLHWINDASAANSNFVTGDLLFTFELDPKASAGQQDAAYLSINACDHKQQKAFSKAINAVKPINKAATLATAIDGNDAVSFGPNGNIYVSHFGTFGASGSGDGQLITQVTPEGESSVYVNGLSGPLGQHWGSDGNLYVINGSNWTNGQLLKVSPAGEKSLVAEIPGFPTNVVEDKSGDFYVSNFASTVLTKISKDGSQANFADHPDLNGIVGMVYDNKREKIIGANYINGKILSIDASGDITLIAQVPAGIGYITAMNNKIYATGISSNRIYQVSLSGKVKLIGGSGDPISQDGATPRMQFNNPNGIAADPLNRILYISEFGGDNNLRSVQLR